MNGFRPSHSDNDIFGIYFNIIRAKVIGNGLPKVQKSLGGTIAENLLIKLLEGIPDRLRRRNVRLADIDEINMDPPLLGLIGIGLQLSDRRFLDIQTPLRYIHIRFLLNKY